jgi:hypothetical protein
LVEAVEELFEVEGFLGLGENLGGGVVGFAGAAEGLGAGGAALGEEVAFGGLLDNVFLGLLGVTCGA